MKARVLRLAPMTARTTAPSREDRQFDNDMAYLHSKQPRAFKMMRTLARELADEAREIEARER